MARPTTEFKTSTGVKVVLYTYLTAREANEIKDTMMRAMKIDLADIKKGMETAPMKGQVDGSIILEQEKKLVSFLIQSLDDSTDNLEARVGDLPVSDYREIVGKLNEIQDGPLVPTK